MTLIYYLIYYLTSGKMGFFSLLLFVLLAVLQSSAASNHQDTLIRTSIITINPDQLMLQHPSIYTLAEHNSPTTEAVLSLRGLSWEGYIDNQGMRGWRALLQRESSGTLRLQILLEIQADTSPMRWKLTFNVMFISMNRGLKHQQGFSMTLAKVEHYNAISISDADQKNLKSFNRQILISDNNLESSQIIESKLFVLLNGFSLNRKDSLDINIQQDGHNQTYIFLKNNLKGIRTLYYSILLINQEKLLRNGYYLQTGIIFSDNISIEKQNEFTQLIRYQRTKGNQWQLDIESWQWEEFKLRKINCSGYWLRQNNRCESSCLEFYKVGDVLVCISSSRLLVYCSYGCVSCPASITNCAQCERNIYGDKVCKTCNTYYYKTNSGTCGACPAGCTSCDFRPIWAPHIHCLGCFPTFTHQSNEPHQCVCSGSQVVSSGSPPACITCPTGCSGCSSISTCTSCNQGYYLSGSTCVVCMPVCKTCSNGASCSSCINNLALSGSICVCNSPNWLNPSTKTCISCATNDPNCAACAYDPSYNPASPTPIICVTPEPGYFVQPDGSTSLCEAYCLTCTSATACTSCSSTFTEVTGDCVCISPLFLSNTPPKYCENCTVLIPGCDLCQTNTVTECISCISNYYPASAYPTAGCLPCPGTCSSCISPTECLECPAPFNLTNITGGALCLCQDIDQYVSLDQTSCIGCNDIIVGCIQCDDTLPTTCSTCDIGYSPSIDNLLCLPCLANCLDCTTTSNCLTCNTGYTWNGVSCDCDTMCQGCLALTGGACSSCTNATDCDGCAAGWYLDGSICLACLPLCSACNNGSTCIGCKPTYTLTPAFQCQCGGGLYLSLDGITCQLCENVIAECTSCLATPATVCMACSDGFYLDTVNNLCQPCAFPCVTCTGSNSSCDSCFPTYTVNISDSTCYCNSTEQLFYSEAFSGCLACSLLINKCTSCLPSNSNLTEADCILCSDPYYVDNTTNNTCQLCDIKCTSCTQYYNCSACATNLILVGILCECNTTADPFLSYYSGTNVCVSCLDLLSNCLICNPDPLACTSCVDGTYPSGGICMACPTDCATCDSTGCLTCPFGTTLSNSNCICGTACQDCQASSLNCVSCTLDPATGLLSSCFSCLPGYYVAADGVSCSPCPSRCITCSSGSVCLTCTDSYVLIGASCQCDSSLNLYSSLYGQCQQCGYIIDGCKQCFFDGTITSCLECSDGKYLNGTICSSCDPSCLTCSSQTVCTSCPLGYDLASGSCGCGASCLACSANVAYCSVCTLNINGTFSQCKSCQPTYYLDPSTYICTLCPSECLTCDSNAWCTSCSYTFEVVNGTCDCNSDKKLILNTNSNLCQACNYHFPRCTVCQNNSNSSIGYECIDCQRGYYWFNDTCTLEVCGDGIVTPSEECDDANDMNLDGCYNCKIEKNFNCTGEPSVCVVSMNYHIYYDSTETSTTVCNQVIIFFRLDPVYESYNTANFTKMLAYQNSPDLQLKPNQFVYYSGVVGYKFEYSGDLVGTDVIFMFNPKLLGLPQTWQVPIYKVAFTITESVNTVALKHIDSNICDVKEKINTIIDAVTYSSYGLLALSALPAKIVGLQLFGVIQLTFLSLGSMDHLNPLQASFTKLSASNGYKLQLDQNEPTNTRLLQTTALTSQRVQTIGYASNFLRNCNLMVMIVAGVMGLSFLLYLFTYCCQDSPWLYGLTRRLFKELLLTLILFNCFNFAYCAGLHLAYADPNDELYIWGTVAAAGSLVVPLMMVGVLQCTEEEGFGEYKEKLKKGKVQRAYFMVTILYRMGIGFYMATMNEDDLSTLIVLLLSIYFLLYNLVNLPFRKAYHNYRANICHISQFIILYLTMYYRSMNEGTSQAELDSLVVPVYLQLGALGLCILVSLIVLLVEIYFWIRQLHFWCCQESDNECEIVHNEGSSNQDHIVVEQNPSLSFHNDMATDQNEIIKRYS